MDKIKIQGGNVLSGNVTVSGAKNSALPILFASVLTDKQCRFTRVPTLQDIRTTYKILNSVGIRTETDFKNHSVIVDASQVSSLEATYDLVRTMRASIIILGPMLARFHKAKVSLPGGCAIGARPINYHLSGLKQLGAQISLEEGYVIAECKGLVGNRVVLEYPSVGATENLMMAAALAKGETVLENCAMEPEIVDLANLLRSMGSEILGDGTSKILIQGRASLKGCDFPVMGDRIEAGTYLCAGFITGGSVTVQGISPHALTSVLSKFEEAGALIDRKKDSITLKSQGRPKSVDISTLPFPGFPTDMQAQFMALMSVAQGTSSVQETVFENRFMHVPELTRLGAEIEVKGSTAIIKGTSTLKGAPLMATDLRASASLILAGLVAQGHTTVSRIYHLDRGYEDMDKKLRALGANIERIKEEN